jgi:hypothetical protein
MTHPRRSTSETSATAVKTTVNGERAVAGKVASRATSWVVSVTDDSGAPALQ